MAFSDSPILGRFVGSTAPTTAQAETMKLVAASAVIEALRKIVGRYELPDDVAVEARIIINKAERAFGFESIAERER